MNYAEAAYYDGAHVKHIADYYEQQRLVRKERDARIFMQRVERERPMLRLVKGGK